MGPPLGATLPRNDPRQYDELAAHWWQADGPFAMLHWLAGARARLIPPAPRPDAVLVDIGCGAGLLAPHVAGKGYRHIGVDLVDSALRQAVGHGVGGIRGDAQALPLAAGSADVVTAGEILEHVRDARGAVAEACRVLRPGGRLVLDTLNATWLSRLIAVRMAEALPGVPPGLHDPNLFVPPAVLIDECARHGVRLRVRGVRPTVWATATWVTRHIGQRLGRRPGARPARIVPTWTTAVLYQGVGVKDGG